jgi:hypothetical protein
MAAPPQFTAEDVLRSAWFQYTDAGLRLPPLPRPLLPKLENFAAWHYGTVEGSPADRPGLVAAAADPTTEDHVVFGHVGHGTGSWSIAARLVVGPLAAFVRHPWGGSRGDPAVDSVAVHKSFHALEALVVLTKSAREAGRLGRADRLLVVDDSVQGGGWQVVGPGGGAWQASRTPLADARAWLDAT